jgi:putative transposase
MALPRSKYVQEGKVGVYHCYSRCVRRAFLCGFDTQTGRDFSHRTVWIADRLRFLVSVFAIEVSSFSVMSDHYHTTVRVRPDIADCWSDYEVASRWLTLCPKRYKLKKAVKEPLEEQIRNLALGTERIAELRKRLCSLSWFMKHLNEFIARAANKEDNIKGRFWESRFKCQALLDKAAIAACMVYVDLNPIRAGLAVTPEDSDFTSIQQRIRDWHKEMKNTASFSTQTEQNHQALSPLCNTSKSGNTCGVAKPVFICTSATGDDIDSVAVSNNWLCPISSEANLQGILPMTTEEYFDLVDRSGRMIRSDKRGSIDADLATILQRIGARPEAWTETVSHFEDKFRLVAGLIGNLRIFADQVGRRWFAGVSAARASFTHSLPQ